MKYFTWKLDWSSGEGIDPTSFVNNDSVRIEPLFATGNLQDSNTLVYAHLLNGDIDITALTRWQVTETTEDEVFKAAQTLNPNATLDNGQVKFPPITYTA